MHTVLGLHLLDAAIVAIALVVVLLIGFLSARGVKQESDFFVSGRSMGAWLQFFLNFGQATDSNGAPTIATEVYRQGVGGMWIGFQTLFITPFIWFTCVWFRRTRLITGPDLFIDRFNSKKLATFYAWYTALTIPLTLGLGNIISCKVASAMMLKPASAYTQIDQQSVLQYKEYQQLKERFSAGALTPADSHRYAVLDGMEKRGRITSNISYLRPLQFYVCYTAIVAVSIMLGGIKAAAVTDAFQGILIIVLSVLLIPLGLQQVGGFHGLHASAPEFKFLLFGSPSMSDYTWYSIFAIVFAGLVTFGAPNGAATAAAKNESALRLGTLSGLFLKRFVMIAWMMCGLIAAAIFSKGISDPDQAWGMLTMRLLPTGLIGLMISGMLLGHMPSVGNSAVNFSATFTRNLYEPLFPGRSSRHYLFVAKASIVGALVAGVICAMFFTGVIELLSALITFGTYFGAVCFLIYFWRKLTATAVGIGAVIWIVLMTIVAWGLPQVPALRQSPALVLQTPQQTVQINAPADSTDIAAGRATRPGQIIRRSHVLDPRAVFFDRVAPTNPADPASPPEGLGRFNVEVALLSCIGLPVAKLNSAWLMFFRWMFDALFPFLLVMSLSYLTQPSDGQISVVEEPAPDSADDAGGVAIQHRTHRETEMLRIARFYAKMKTPVAATPELDRLEVEHSYRSPERFEHLKLFPGSSWEFTRWDRADYLGFFGCWCGVFAILLFLWLVLRIGS